MRIGTGGTMIMHYSPLKIAEDFKTLSVLAPDRIDLGLGRAPGSGPMETYALAQGNTQQRGDPELYDKMETILEFLLDKTPKDNLYKHAKAVPRHPERENLCQPWMLGSTGQSAVKGGEMGLGYSFVKWFGRETPKKVFDDYREAFEPSEFFDQPLVSISYKILVAENEEHLAYHGKAFDYNHLAPSFHLDSFVVSPDQVKDFTFTESQKAKLQEDYEKRYIIKGTPDQVKKILDDEIKEYGIDELMFYSPIYDDQAREKSYALLADLYKDA